MILYSIRRGPRGHSITKFDEDLNPVASYDVSVGSCTCPAGPRPTCRHRKMLARMLPKVDSVQFYCYETQTWHRPLQGEAVSKIEPPTESKMQPPDNGELIEAELFPEPPKVETFANRPYQASMETVTAPTPAPTTLRRR